MLKLIERHKGPKDLFKCECGSEKMISRTNVKSGSSKSCGCLKRIKSDYYRKYPKEYNTWSGMKARCGNPKNKDFYRYGGRGINVCDRWLSSFPSFIDDMGGKPSPEHSLDRINNAEGYSKDNCRWASVVEQNNNRRTNRIMTHYGISLTLSEWESVLEIPKGRIDKRIKKYNYSEHDAIFNPKVSPSESLLSYRMSIEPKTRGTANKNSKLTEEQVLKIRSSKRSKLALSKRYKVTTNTIGHIINRKTWTHI